MKTPEAFATHKVQIKFNKGKMVRLAVLTSAVVLLVVQEASGQLAIYEFDKSTGVPNPNVTVAPTGATYSEFQRVNLVADTSGPHVWDSTDWATTIANDSTKYVGFTVTSWLNGTVTLTDISFDVKRESSKGPKNAAMELFLDGKSQGYYDYSPTKLPGELVTWNFNDITFGNGSVAEFRFYGWNAEENKGHLSFDNVKTSGTSVVPELTSGSIVGIAAALGITASGIRRWHRNRKKTTELANNNEPV